MACPYKRTDDDVDDGDDGINGKQSDSVPKKSAQGLNYSNYLKLDKLLSCTDLESAKHGNTKHDEHLFIITHQTYELWFKQILWEIDSVIEMFKEVPLKERRMLVIMSRLNRIVEIEKVLVHQFSILQTMTPQDFMSFRDYLNPASGFQSLQFRILENKLGLKQSHRIRYQQKHYSDYFSAKEIAVLESHSSKESEENGPESPRLGNESLLSVVEQWFERVPGLEVDGFNFWEKFRNNVQAFLAEQRRVVVEDESVAQGEKEDLLKECEKNEANFACLFDAQKHAELIERGDRKISHKALQGALMILLYSDEPRFAVPHTIINLLIDIDHHLMKWRSQHVLLVQRMLGSKMGTGGSSGYLYLRSTLGDKYKVWVDLANLASYLVPRHVVPEMTEDMLARMRTFDA